MKALTIPARLALGSVGFGLALVHDLSGAAIRRLEECSR